VKTVLTVSLDEYGSFVCEDHEHDITTEGKSIEEALEAWQDELQAYIDDAEEELLT
jgi:predicted RNase H-like HicB family nuclease